jgi:hypothetical protein
MAGASIGASRCGVINPARRNRSPLRLPAYLRKTLTVSRDAMTVPCARIVVKEAIQRKEERRSMSLYTGGLTADARDELDRGEVPHAAAGAR